jgi:hypothetical protein
MNEGMKEGRFSPCKHHHSINQFSAFQSSPSFSHYYIMMLERTYVHEVNKGKYEELVVTQVGKYKYLVYNRMKDTAYYVNVTYTGRFTWFSCECKAFEFNKGKCKHVDAVKQFIEDQKLEEMNKNIAKENTAELIDF